MQTEAKVRPPPIHHPSSRPISRSGLIPQEEPCSHLIHPTGHVLLLCDHTRAATTRRSGVIPIFGAAVPILARADPATGHAATDQGRRPGLRAHRPRWDRAGARASSRPRGAGPASRRQPRHHPACRPVGEQNPPRGHTATANWPPGTTAAPPTVYQIPLPQAPTRRSAPKPPITGRHACAHRCNPHQRKDRLGAALDDIRPLSSAS